jgi:Transcriptional regulatory protein, C terminal
VDLERQELRADGQRVPVGMRAFEIIEVLVRSAGKLVTKDDLMRAVWPGAIVEEATLWVHISAIRKALGSDRPMLRTVSRPRLSSFRGLDGDPLRAHYRSRVRADRDDRQFLPAGHHRLDEPRNPADRRRARFSHSLAPSDDDESKPVLG